MKYNFKIEGLDCANCAAELEEKLKKVEGVDSVSISFMSERMNFECDENQKDEVINKIKKVIKKEEPDCSISEI